MARLPFVLFMAAAGLSVSVHGAAHNIAASTDALPDALDALVEAHMLLDRDDPASLLRALELLYRAGGHVLTWDGRPADLGYDALYARLYPVFSAAEMDSESRRRFASLPAPMRGDARGWVKAEVSALPERAHGMQFNANEPAIVYVRAGRAMPITLKVANANGRTLCKASSKKGRALCRWQPKQAMRVTVRVSSAAFGRDDTVEIYTN